MIAVCPGSFDPVTYGHLDVVARAAQLFDEVIVAVGDNSAKKYLLTLNERIRLLESAITELLNVRVTAMTGLLVDFCQENQAKVVVKGVRFASDLDYELQMAHVNGEIGGIETVLLPASREWGTISSTLVRDVARHGGDISTFVPDMVSTLLQQKFVHDWGVDD